MKNLRKGIDVSSYQGNIDWERAKEYIDFAIIRCGYGNNITSQDDIKFERNAESCKIQNIPFGVYLFSYATNLNMAQSEVDHTLRLIKNHQLEYPVFLDVEEKAQLSLPKEKLVEIVKYYCDKIEKAGYYVGIYASLSTLNGILNSEELDPYDKWVAEWGRDLNYHKPCGLWQNTNDARIPGIETRVDGDIAFYDYPKIIRENGLNHLEEKKETIDLKYKVGDKVYLNGSIYKNEDGKEEIEKHRNQKVTITKTNNTKGVTAPYEVNHKGYVKESDLSDKLTCTCICARIIQFIKSLFRKE